MVEFLLIKREETCLNRQEKSRPLRLVPTVRLTEFHALHFQLCNYRSDGFGTIYWLGKTNNLLILFSEAASQLFCYNSCSFLKRYLEHIKSSRRLRCHNTYEFSRRRQFFYETSSNFPGEPKMVQEHI